MELFKEQKLINKQGELVESENILKNRIVALYFSAKWSPPCREFTPKLVEIYDELKVSRKAPFEVVFISCDKNEEDMLQYMNELHGNWWALEYKNPFKEEIHKQFKVNMVPKLLIIKPSGELVTEKGRKEVEDRGIVAFRNWLASAGIATARVKTPDFTTNIFEEETTNADSQEQNVKKVDSDESTEDKTLVCVQ